MPSVVVLLDLHPWLGTNASPPDTQLVRALKDTVRFYKDGSGAADADPDLADAARSPPDLESLVTLVDFPLPTEPQIRATLDGMIARNTAAGALKVELGPAGAERLAKAALGLTAFEAENAFARSMVDDGRLTDDDIALVQEEKRQIVQKSGVLEVVDVVDQPGRHRRAGEPEDLAAQAERVLDGRGALAYGLPAAEGRAGHRACRAAASRMTAKAMASAWSLPLVRLDIGRVFGGLVGASPSRTCARRCAPPRRSRRACMWIDEIEKGFASGASGSGDSGTSARVFGTFLTLDAGEDRARCSSSPPPTRSRCCRRR